ncbi:hypothetical protein [Motiliproteus sediminis]|uniref:hypothetical protein n=1 Tax=Motiliproteus sediminis TaxID=1468178 RepID=UPI001AEF4D05|nr:hypothetical protein [Motiliproteus sediminis]
MGAKVALFFLLDSSKAATPQNYGMQLPIQKVAPLYDSLNGTCRFAKMSFPDSTVYGLSYFKKPFHVDMLVVVKELENFSYATITSQCQAQLAKILNVKEQFFHADYLHRALWLPRGLQKQEFVNLVSLYSGDPDPKLDSVSRLDAKDYWVMNWREGFIFGGRNEADFSRSLALYGLGLAYHRVMSKAINQLAQAADTGGDALMGLKIEAGRFRAQYHFDNPVRPSHTELADVYNHMVKSLRLPAVKAEFDLKLEAVTALTQLKQNRSRLGGEGGLGDLFRRDHGDEPAAGAIGGATRGAMPPVPKHKSESHTPRRRRPLLWILLLLALLAAGYWYLPGEYKQQLSDAVPKPAATSPVPAPSQ